MRIEFIAFVKLDFNEVSELDEVTDALEEVYGESGEAHAGPTFEGGHWSHRVFGNADDNPLEEDPDIRWIRTVIESNVRGIIDVVTVGLLSEEKIEAVLNEDAETLNEYNRFKQKVRDYLNEVPSIVGDERRNEGYITYIEPADDLGFTGADGADVEAIQSIVSTNANLLSRLDFPTGGYLTLHRGNLLVAQTVLMDPYNRLSVLSRGFERGHNEPDRLTTWPVWYRSLAILTAFFRAYYWTTYRREVVREFDQRTETQRDAWLGGSPDQREFDSTLEMADDVHALDLDWVEIYTRLVDELDHLQFLFREDDEDRIPFWPEPVEIPPSETRVIHSRPEGERDLMSIYTADIRNRLPLLGSDIERVDDKVRKLSSTLQDVISVSATEENIRLQRRLGWLTAALFFLTLVLVVLTAELVF